MAFPDFSWLVGPFGIVGVLLFSFLVGLLPFASPSNALIALGIAVTFPQINVFAIGLAVAVGATAAKTIHFAASYGVGKILDKKRPGRRSMIGKYGKLTMYVLNIIAAATPIPDEWIVIPMGLSEVSVVWFMATYFLGKIIITVPSAYLGNAVAPVIYGIFGENMIAATVAAAVITVVITVAFILMDVEKTMLRILKRLGIIKDEPLRQQEDKAEA